MVASCVASLVGFLEVGTASLRRRVESEGGTISKNRTFLHKNMSSVNSSEDGLRCFCASALREDHYALLVLNLLDFKFGKAAYVRLVMKIMHERRPARVSVAGH